MALTPDGGELAVLSPAAADHGYEIRVLRVADGAVVARLPVPAMQR